MDDEFELSAPPLRPPLQNSSAPRDKEPDDLQKLIKWQEERLARRLRGEYESAVLHLSEVVSCSHLSRHQERYRRLR
jgi:outer membrane protein insertion porin family